MPLVLNHQTPARFFVRFREAYRNADREGLAKITKWVLERIAAGDITDTQARNAFGMTVSQWNTRKTQMADLVLKYDAIQSARGD